MSSFDVIIREGRREDCAEIRRLIQELADFEEMSAGPQINEKILERDGFDTNPPLFHTCVAEVKDKHNQQGSKGVQLAGYVAYYYTYSTWRGKKLFMEDIIVSAEFRRRKIGSKLFQEVAKKAVETGCAYVEFSVLAWNPARAFYERMGSINFTELEQWHYYRLNRTEMHNVAEGIVS